MTAVKTKKGTSREEGELLRKSAGGTLLGDYLSGLQCLAMTGLTLLSALPLLLGKRPRRERRRRLDTTSSRDEFQEPTQPAMSGEAFAGAQTFQDLFQRLDAKRVLWGSQKRYTAKELKALINRVRTTNPQFHLPLEVIPATGGLRERVKALAGAEAGADEGSDGRHARPKGGRHHGNTSQSYASRPGPNHQRVHRQ